MGHSRRGDPIDRSPSARPSPDASAVGAGLLTVAGGGLDVAIPVGRVDRSEIALHRRSRMTRGQGDELAGLGPEPVPVPRPAGHVHERSRSGDRLGVVDPEGDVPAPHEERLVPRMRVRTGAGARRTDGVEDLEGLGVGSGGEDGDVEPADAERRSAIVGRNDERFGHDGSPRVETTTLTPGLAAGIGRYEQNGAMRPPLAEQLDLAAHPEGGWYRRVWTSPERAAPADGRDRAAASMILFLLEAGTGSTWHRVASEEVWVAQHGRVVLELGGTGSAPSGAVGTVVAPDPGAGAVPVAVVPARTWQRARAETTDALVACVVSPEFHFDDFELAAPPTSEVRGGPGRLG